MRFLCLRGSSLVNFLLLCQLFHFLGYGYALVSSTVLYFESYVFYSIN